jgi:hypothetical protein
VDLENLESLIDGNLTQREVQERLRAALGQGEIPPHIRERREAYRRAHQGNGVCRKCQDTDQITRHHFVNKWMLKLLHDYKQHWGHRWLCTIPLCLTCHRRLHSRDDSDKSIIELLRPEELDFAQTALEVILYQRPAVARLPMFGDPCVYEAQLMHDFRAGHFKVVATAQESPLALAA